MSAVRLVLFLGYAALACGRSGPPRSDTAPLAPVSVATPDAGPPPLAGRWLEDLELDGGGVAYVAPPLGATEPRPVVVAVHGAHDHPAQMCAAWRVIADGFAFVVCPAGARSGNDAFVWGSSDAIDRAVDRALEAARRRYGERMAAGPAVYAAFSQGANMAGPVLGPRNRARFARAALTEGGSRAFEDPGLSSAYAKTGERLLYTCSQAGCVGWFAGSKASLARRGVEVRVHSAGAVGHAMAPEVRASLNADLPWLVEGLASWEGYARAPRLPAH